MAKAAVLNIEVLANVQHALTAFETMKSKASGSFDVLKGVGLAAGAALGAGVASATHAAMEHEQTIAKLQTAYKNAGVSASEMSKGVEEVESSTRRTGQSTEDSLDAYTKLITATRSSKTAIEDLGVAQDLAAFKGVSVTTATNAVIRAQEGNTRALKSMGIATTDASGKQLSAAAVMKNLTAAVHGQADAMGDTASGKMARYHESLDQVQVAIGSALVPALSQLLDILQPVFSWLANNQAILHVLVPVIAALGGAVLAVSAATRVWTAVQTILNLVLSANPIGLIIIAIAALVGGVIYAYTHFKIFRDAVSALWSIIESLVGFITDHWQLALDIMLGPIGVLITHLDWLHDAFDHIIDVLQHVKDLASDAFGWLGKVGGFLSKVPGLGSLSAGPSAPVATPTMVAVYVQPGDSFPEAVYRGLLEYQRRHIRPELAPLFGRG